MKTLLVHVLPARGQPPSRRSRFENRSNGRHRDRRPNTIQLVYAHLPPAVIMATGQHLRAQTQIEKQAHQLWFERGSRPGDALGNWLRAEREVVRELCAALLPRHPQEPEVTAAAR